MEDQTAKEELKEIVKKLVEEELKEFIHQFDVFNNAIKQRHIDGAIIKIGLAADLPTDGDASKVFAYFETDTPALKIWDGDSWVTI